MRIWLLQNSNEEAIYNSTDKEYQIGDNDELYFRDYLNEHPQIAKTYEVLKLELWKKYEHNRYAYTEAKTDFIRKWTTEARIVYGKRS